MMRAMPLRPRLAAATAAVGLALWLTACTNTGGDKASVKRAATTTSATIAEPEGSSFAEANARARVAAVNLAASDFSQDWQSEPSPDGGVSALHECATSDVSSQLLAKGRSASFFLGEDPGQMQFRSTTNVFDGEAAAADLLNEFRDDAFVSCASELFNTAEDGYKVRGSLARTGSEPGLADEAVALSGDYVLTPNDGSTPSRSSAVVVAMRGGDTVVIVSAAAIDTQVDETLLRDLLDAVGYRVTE